MSWGILNLEIMIGYCCRRISVEIILNLKDALRNAELWNDKWILLQKNVFSDKSSHELFLHNVGLKLLSRHWGTSSLQRLPENFSLRWLVRECREELWILGGLVLPEGGDTSHYYKVLVSFRSITCASLLTYLILAGILVLMLTTWGGEQQHFPFTRWSCYINYNYEKWNCFTWFLSWLSWSLPEQGGRRRRQRPGCSRGFVCVRCGQYWTPSLEAYSKLPVWICWRRIHLYICSQYTYTHLPLVLSLCCIFWPHNCCTYNTRNKLVYLMWYIYI